MSKVVTFGEIMLRLSPENYLRLTQSEKLNANFGGAEANIAVSLASFGVDCAFVSKLPAHEIGQMAVNSLRKFGVDTSNIIRGGDRVGVYYYEKGASQRPSKVVYDRVGSAIATASEDEFNWENIFNGATWFHFTGITPALSESMEKACLLACKCAKEKGITISCDLNYRSKLWSKERAKAVMSSLCEYVDYLFIGREDAKDIFGIEAPNTSKETDEIDKDSFVFTAEKLVEKFNLKGVAITLRESISASDNNWSAMLYNGKQAVFSKKYALHIIDRVGGGDSFDAGIIYSLLNNYEPQQAVEFAVASSALKHSVEGDFNLVSVEEVKTLANGNGTGRVQR